MNIFSHIENEMERYADSVVKEGKNIFTYKEVLVAVRTLARKISKSAKSGQKAAILCESELNMAISILACFKAGVTAIPTTDRYGERYCQRIVDICKPDILIREVNSENSDDNRIVIDKVNNDFDENLCDVALIMYTSGTSGTPKGVMLTYSNILSNLQDINEYFEVGNDDKILILRSVFHMAVLMGELLISLYRGVNIEFFNQKFDPIRAIKIIESEEITIICATPTILFYLLKFIDRFGKNVLRVIVSSGECMTKIIADRLIEKFPMANIYNVYGMTEASPRIAYLDYRLFRQYKTAVGVPLKSVECKISAGQLFVKGPNIMKGYYKKTAQNGSGYELSSIIDADGWLRTGDAAVIENGIITIKGRMDNMIIKGGMNIYPEEIENVLKSVPLIVDVLAVGIKSLEVGEKILLKIVPENEAIKENDIFQICKEKLPQYMLPDSIEIVDDIERNAVGKVVRRNV